MKKVYLLMPLTMWLSSSFGQTTIELQNNSEVSRENFELKQNVEISEKAAGVVVWMSDFTNSSDWVIDNDGQTGATSGFNIDNTESSWFFTTVINSNSDGAFAEVNNNGTQAPHVGVNYTLTTSAPIDITGSNGFLKIDFLQYGARFRDLQEVKISTDGINFVTVGNNQDIPQLTAGGGTAYTNPSLKSVYLSSVLSGSETQLWIQFSWTSAITGSTTNNDWITYGWMIDDVVLTTFADNDLTVVSDTVESAGLFYSLIPLLQVAPIEFSAAVVNTGKNTSENAKFTINVNNGQFTSSSTPVDILANISDTVNLQVNNAYTPSTLGAYTVTRTVSSDSTDDATLNNTLSDVTFQVTEYLYARDNTIKQTAVVSGRSGTAPNFTYEPFETGNFYDIYQNQTLYALDVFFNNNGNGATANNKEIYAKLYEYDFAVTGSAARIYKGESDLVITNQDMVTGKATLIFQAPILLEANKTYLAMVGTASDSVSVAIAGTSLPGTSFILYPSRPEDSQFFFLTGTPMVRMNFNPNVAGVIENDELFSDVTIYPNPTSNVSTIDYSLASASDVTIEVKDVNGKSVMVNTLTNQTVGGHTYQIDTKGLNNGVYFVTLSNEQTTVTKKLIKK